LIFACPVAAGTTDDGAKLIFVAQDMNKHPINIRVENL